MFGGAEPAPQADIAPFVNERPKTGRLRKYEEVGIYGDMPVKEVVRFRFVHGRYPEGVSKDMEDEYNYWYFTPPNKRKDKDKYEKHIRAWNRRTKWLEGISEARGPDPAAIIDLQEERKRRRC